LDWQRLGTPAPSRLRRAREQAHWAVQVIAAAGETFLRHVPDTSHTAMRWDAGREALVGQPIPGARPCRVALRMADLALLLLADGSAASAELSLAGRTLAEADRWAADAVERHTRGEHDRALVHPAYELPPHALAAAGRFECDAGLPELARWYANADRVLRRLERETPGAGPVLCWPHHFDIATLITVESDGDGNATRTVGVGLSPGDDSIDEPYWYVNHGPETERAELPPIAAGEWFTTGWIAAVLRGDSLVAAGDAAAQEAQLRRYLASALAASRELALEGRLA
jgi:hypothetical protein